MGVGCGSGLGEDFEGVSIIITILFSPKQYLRKDCRPRYSRFCSLLFWKMLCPLLALEHFFIDIILGTPSTHIKQKNTRINYNKCIYGFQKCHANLHSGQWMWKQPQTLHIHHFKHCEGQIFAWGKKKKHPFDLREINVLFLFLFSMKASQIWKRCPSSWRRGSSWRTSATQTFSLCWESACRQRARPSWFCPTWSTATCATSSATRDTYVHMQNTCSAHLFWQWLEQLKKNDSKPKDALVLHRTQQWRTWWASGCRWPEGWSISPARSLFIET